MLLLCTRQDHPKHNITLCALQAAAAFHNMHRRDQLPRSFFQTILSPVILSHYLLPPLRNTSVISRLRSTTSYPRPTSRTEKYQSFITYGIHQYRPDPLILILSFMLNPAVILGRLMFLCFIFFIACIL